MVRLKVLTKGKEYIITRKANKNHRCHECHCLIAKGTNYIQDNINYAAPTRDGGGYKKYYTNKICLICWRGDKP